MEAGVISFKGKKSCGSSLFLRWLGKKGMLDTLMGIPPLPRSWQTKPSLNSLLGFYLTDLLRNTNRAFLLDWMEVSFSFHASWCIYGVLLFFGISHCWVVGFWALCLCLCLLLSIVLLYYKAFSNIVTFLKKDVIYMLCFFFPELCQI